MEETIYIASDASEIHSAEKLGDAWASARGILSERLSSGNFKTWIEPLKMKAAEDGKLTLAGPNPFFLNWVKSHFIGDISEALLASGVGCALELTTALEHSSPLESMDPALFDKAHSQEKKRADAEPVPAPRVVKSGLLPFNSRFSFDSFVVGDSNRYAFSAAKALSAGVSLGSDALFITSDHGLGKSHLSQALGRAFLESKPRDNVYYLTAEDFTNEMTHAIRHGGMEDFKTKYRHSCDVLVLEEVQFLAGKEKIQSELCFTLDCLMERGRKVVFTSPQEPKEIPRLGRSLRSRLSAALVSPIGSPEYETRLNILLKKAKAIDLKTSRSVLEYVAERIRNDVRQLESCLISLKAKSQLLGRQVDMDMAREVLAYLFDEHQEGGLTPMGIRAVICRHFHLEVSEITSKDRSTRVNEARTLGMYLARNLTGRTLEEIGQIFGRTHSSALYAINKMEKQLKKDPRLQGKIEFLTQKMMG